MSSLRNSYVCELLYTVLLHSVPCVNLLNAGGLLLRFAFRRLGEILYCHASFHHFGKFWFVLRQTYIYQIYFLLIYTLLQ